MANEPAPSPTNGPLRPVPDANYFKVQPSQVLAVASLLEDQANAFSDRLARSLTALRVDHFSSDSTSTKAVNAWNLLIADGPNSHLDRAKTYLDNLRAVIGQLRAGAEMYNLKDDEVATAFQDRNNAALSPEVK